MATTMKPSRSDWIAIIIAAVVLVLSFRQSAFGDEGFKGIAKPGFKTDRSNSPTKTIKPTPIDESEPQSVEPKVEAPEVAEAVVPARKAIEIVQSMSAMPLVASENAITHYRARVHCQKSCPPCRQMERRWPHGDANVELEYTLDPPPPIFLDGKPIEPRFPCVTYTNAKGESRFISEFGMISPERVLQWIKSDNPHELVGDKPIPVGSMPAIRDDGLIGRTLDQIAQYLGPDVVMNLKWIRKKAKQNLIWNEPHTLEDVIGTDSHFVIDISSVSRGYKIHHEMDCNPLMLKPNDGKVGCPLLILWTVVSVAWDVYDLLHPQVSLYLPETIEVNCRLVDGTAVIDFGPNPPAVQIRWSFWLGLLKVESNRPLTGLRISRSKLAAEFHRSRIYRDLVLDIQPTIKTRIPEVTRSDDPVAALARDK